MAQCSSGNHFSSIQLFYALKQQFPDVPDKVVTLCIQRGGGDEEACKGILESDDFTSYHRLPRRPSFLHLNDDGKDGKLPSSFSAPTTPCSITRRRPVLIDFNGLGPRPRGTEVIIQAQLIRKHNLERELDQDKKKLSEMKQQFDELKSLLLTKSPLQKINSLNEEIRCLQAECIQLDAELNCCSRDAEKTTVVPSSSHVTANGGDGLLVGETEPWRCTVCTFHNHPLLHQCEYCAMPRFAIEGRERQDILIHVTHHNLPKCKVVHSWAV